MNRLDLLAKRISSDINDKNLEKILISICPNSKIGFLTLNSPKDLNSLSARMLD
jgi:hypothetical protein